MSSIIGVSQSQNAIPRILEKFLDVSSDGKSCSELSNIRTRSNRRTLGGISSWQPDKWKTSSQNGNGQGAEDKSNAKDKSDAGGRKESRDSNDTKNGKKTTDRNGAEGGDKNSGGCSDSEGKDNISTTPCRPSFKCSMVLGTVSTVPVLVGTVSAWVITAMTPPEGLDCRHWLQGLISLIWLLSALSNFPLSHLGPRRRFYWTFAKDILAMFSTSTGIFLAVIGIFNRCSCWTKQGHVGLVLPYEPFVAAILSHRIKILWPSIIGVCAAIQILFICSVCYHYWDAFRVLVQSDGGDDISEALSRTGTGKRLENGQGNPTGKGNQKESATHSKLPKGQPGKNRAESVPLLQLPGGESSRGPGRINERAESRPKLSPDNQAASKSLHR